jgi:hypothetical protein
MAGIKDGRHLSFLLDGKTICAGDAKPQYLQTGQRVCLRATFGRTKYKNVRIVGSLDLQWYLQTTSAPGTHESGSP